MRLIALLALLALAVPGCASHSASSPKDDRPVLTRTLYGPDGNPTSKVEVSIRGDIYGRGCQGLYISPDGKVVYGQQQDASTDYAAIRGSVAIVPESLGIVMGAATGGMTNLLDAVGDRIRGREGEARMAPPSAIHGCEGAAELLRAFGEAAAAVAGRPPNPGPSSGGPDPEPPAVEVVPAPSEPPADADVEPGPVPL